MARTAFTQLHDQIEAVRREAFAAGYAAAMQAVRELAAKAAPGPQASSGAPRRRGARAAQSARAAATPRRRQARSRTATRATSRAGRKQSTRPQRGTNARLVEEVLQSNAPRALPPAEIRNALQRDKGVAMAFTSIRHALGQLEARHAAEQVGNSRTWRYSGGTGAPA